tara:strand:- start:37 stop:258 length:222 start_codon:yes stop_codon:yes gene_type:complete
LRASFISYSSSVHRADVQISGASSFWHEMSSTKHVVVASEHIGSVAATYESSPAWKSAVVQPSAGMAFQLHGA